jgi:pSer/pThr/pTyr-binding forkhead associated (FHA) protein/soluble lytic murein transglycosylase-like protein
MAGTRFPMPEGATRIGRAPDNDVVIDGSDSSTVSLHHVEIRNHDGACHIRDLASTNGTWLNDRRITDAEISAPAIIRLGCQGPELAFILEEAPPADLDRTIEVSPSAAQIPAAGASTASAYEKLVSSAVTRARRMRRHGVGGQTMTIMRGLIDQALKQAHRRFRIIGYSLLAALLAVVSISIWKITALRREKSAIDTHIRQIDAELQKAGEGLDTGNLLSQLSDYSKEGESLQRSLLYRLSSAHDEGDFVTRELRSVMAEFGAEVYSIPADFIDRVNYYIEQDLGSDRPILARALGQSGAQLQTIRRILQQEQLPADLAYIPVVESGLETGQASAAGAVGPWQFTVVTAKTYGLRVDGQVDERKDLVKSTVATCKYLRDLILDFGAGSSVMLALAAYNSGTTTVKRAVSRNVRDPINQRSFWYLYRARALPRETREFVPRVFAAILIGRNPQHFGFDRPSARP